MPLSKSALRRAVHTRVVTCQGYQREDGLWDIEGSMTDTKPFPLPNRDRNGYINAGEALHGMSIRLTIDLDMKVHSAEAVIDHSPFAGCPRIAERFQRLVGLSIVNGWTKQVKEIFAGVDGCTHLTELLGPIATTAFQVLITYKTGDGMKFYEQAKEPPPHLNTCHMLAESSEVVAQRWPQFYRPKVGSE
ncbi:MAG: DUF2889 domain-containing protein [Thiofilum sp.]|uniref:DUF2889 domain-containing protein n=1 Tax=Thiofilum sp. TaxID=2212733 RepID=UPI002601464E|nr:DUF2889 domain-containing protein [Thiofilum sp.]MBK8454722.1 DUF2889 domain-containing protein [Thiofilum sp.]